MIDRYNSVIRLLKNVRASGSEVSARCPAHDDAKSSLSVRRLPAGDILINCFAGCTCEAICKALGIAVASLFAGRRPPDIEHVYTYVDESGKPLREVIRRSGKRWLQRSFLPNGEVAWNVQGVPLLPYRLPQLLAATQNGETILVPEGERDVETLVARGLAATTSPGGASRNWDSRFIEYFRGANVIVIADADRPGRKAALRRTTSLSQVANSVRVIDFGDEAAKGFDSTDFFSAGGTVEQLLALATAVSDSCLSRAIDGPVGSDGADNQQHFSKLYDSINARRDLTPAMKLVYAYIQRNYESRATYGRDFANPSFSATAAACALSARAVKSIVRYLDEHRFIACQRTDGGRQRPNRYEILEPPIEPETVNKLHRSAKKRNGERIASVECLPLTGQVNDLPAHSKENQKDDIESLQVRRRKTREAELESFHRQSETALLRSEEHEVGLERP